MPNKTDSLRIRRPHRIGLILLAGLLLVLCSPAVHAENKALRARAQAMLKRAADLVDLRSATTPAFRLHARLRAAWSADKMEEGTYDLVWMTPSVWREEVAFPGYARIRVGGEGKYWQLRSTDYELLRVYDLDSLLRLAKKLHLSNTEKVKRIKTRKESSAELECIETEAHHNNKYRYCFDETSGALVRIEDPLNAYEYSSYLTLGQLRFPGVLRSRQSKQVELEVEVDDLHSISHAPLALFDPPPGAKAWISCEHPKGGELKSRAAPEYPRPLSSSLSRPQGEVAVYAVIQTDGRLRDLKIVETGGPQLDRATLAAIREWVYTPVTCDGVAIEKETMVSFGFRTQSF